MLLGLILFFNYLSAEVLLRENFNTLDNWEELYFPNIDNHSTYVSKNSILVAKSSDSASAIKLKKTYNIYKYPYLTFKWKIDNVFKAGNAKNKEGDDYPIRIYVMFEYEPSKASFFQSVKYEFAKSLYGEYPPHSSLNYIWSNIEHNEDILTSTYTSQAKMILLNKGSKNIRKWITHKVNVLEDYKKAFKQNPPLNVSIAIMSDSDNTHESNTAYIDFLEVSNE